MIFFFATKMLQLIAPIIFPLKYSVSPKDLKNWAAENETAFSKTPLNKTNIMGLNSNSPRGRKWPPPAGIFLVRLRQALYIRFSNLSLSSPVSSTSGKCCYLNFARSLRSSLFRFLLGRKREPRGSRANAWGESKKRNGGRWWGGKEKPAAEPLHFTKRRSSTNGRQLGITIGQSRVNQNDLCQQLVNRFRGMIRSDQLWP